MRAPSLAASILAAAVLAASPPAHAANPGTYAVGSTPVAGVVGTVQFPVARGFNTEVGAAALGQGTYTDDNPFAYLGLAAGTVWLHFDGVQDLRLSAGFQEFLYPAIDPLGVQKTHEERGVVRARVQQPRGAAALYEMFQLDLRSFNYPTGVHQFAYRPRFRVGQGFNLDAVRVHSLVLYEEVAFHYASNGYYKRGFEFFRTYAGYLWTTKRGTFISLGVLAQVALNPGATRYDFLWGPVLGISYWFRAAAPPETPPPDVEPDIDLE